MNYWLFPGFKKKRTFDDEISFEDAADLVCNKLEIEPNSIQIPKEGLSSEERKRKRFTQIGPKYLSRLAFIYIMCCKFVKKTPYKTVRRFNHKQISEYLGLERSTVTYQFKQAICLLDAKFGDIESKNLITLTLQRINELE